MSESEAQASDPVTIDDFLKSEEAQGIITSGEGVEEAEESPDEVTAHFLQQTLGPGETLEDEPEEEEGDEAEETDEAEASSDEEEAEDKQEEEEGEAEDEEIPAEYALDYKYKGKVELLDLRDKDKLRDLAQVARVAKDGNVPNDVKQELVEQTQNETLAQFFEHKNGKWLPNSATLGWVMELARNGDIDLPIASRDAGAGRGAMQADVASAATAGDSDLAKLKEAAMSSGEAEDWMKFVSAVGESAAKRGAELALSQVDEKLTARDKKFKEFEQQSQRQRELASGESNIKAAQKTLRTFYKDFEGNFEEAEWTEGTQQALAALKQGHPADKILSALQARARKYSEKQSKIAKKFAAATKARPKPASRPKRSGGAPAGGDDEDVTPEDVRTNSPRFKRWLKSQMADSSA